jgi:hypothetical protein
MLSRLPALAIGRAIFFENIPAADDSWRFSCPVSWTSTRQRRLPGRELSCSDLTGFADKSD